MQQPSVLLVEDDAFQRKAAETYLMNHDLKVIAVENGAQMRRQVSRAMPDLVLLDVQLPGQEDGFALARWLRESSTRVGIIMLTAARRFGRQGAGTGERRRRLCRQALRAARASGALQERAAPLGQQGDAVAAGAGAHGPATCSTCPSASCSIRRQGRRRDLGRVRHPEDLRREPQPAAVAATGCWRPPATAAATRSTGRSTCASPASGARSSRRPTSPP